MTPSSELLKKYNVPGPRYTSYPTVPYWADSPTEEQWIASVAEALDEGAKAGIGAALYVHIPFCKGFSPYGGSNTRNTQTHKGAHLYTKSVVREGTLHRKGLGRETPVPELHRGGGPKGKSTGLNSSQLS